MSWIVLAEKSPAPNWTAIPQLPSPTAMMVSGARVTCSRLSAMAKRASEMGRSNVSSGAVGTALAITGSVSLPTRQAAAAPWARRKRSMTCSVELGSLLRRCAPAPAPAPGPGGPPMALSLADLPKILRAKRPTRNPRMSANQIVTARPAPTSELLGRDHL